VCPAIETIDPKLVNCGRIEAQLGQGLFYRCIGLDLRGGNIVIDVWKCLENIIVNVSVFLVEEGMRNVDSDSKMDGGIEMM
jgi:hypothetical protein